MNKQVALSMTALILLGCSPKIESPTPISPTFTSPPEATSSPTTIPSPTPTIGAEPTSSPESSGRRIGLCEMDLIIDEVRAQSPYEKFAAHHNIVNGISTLVVWFVDPALTPAGAGVDIQANQQLALKHAVETIHRISSVDDCLANDIDFINTVIVDPAYYGWLSAQLSPAKTDPARVLDELHIENLIDQLQISYLRSEASELIIQGTCSWKEAESGIWKHFSTERKNLAFYHVIDEFGINVWAQWDGSAEYPILLPSILNILMEVECLDERTNLIFIVVDEQGFVQLLGLIPALNVENLTVLYAE